MPSLTTARRIASAKSNNASTIGQIHKENSDWTMEETFWNDPQSKVAYIYDYLHDDQPDKKDHMTYETTTKTRIDVKLIVKTYSSIDQDQPEFYCQFKPSQKIEFDEGDELYYYETEYRKKYGMEFPLGLFMDIPDDRGIYRKWLVCEKELANQFPKYLILPIDHLFMWIEKDGAKVYKRKMWGVNRSQKSYTIGVYTDKVYTRPDNQQKALFPLNPITEGLWYVDDENKNMRMVVSSKTRHPIVWKITKCENLQPLGIQTLTFYQNYWNDNTDYLEKDSNGNIIGAWADYYESGITPVEQPSSSDNTSSVKCIVSASTTTIKTGGSYKTLSLTVSDNTGDITDSYSDSTLSWSCYIDGDNISDNVIWKNDAKFNVVKLKLPLDRSQLGKLLKIKCAIQKDADTIESEVLELEIVE